MTDTIPVSAHVHNPGTAVDPRHRRCRRLGDAWRCARCRAQFRGNRPACPGCGYTVFEVLLDWERVDDAPIVVPPEVRAAEAVFDALMYTAERDVGSDLARFKDLPEAVQGALVGMIGRVAPTLVRFGREYAPERPDGG